MKGNSFPFTDNKHTHRDNRVLGNLYNTHTLVKNKGSMETDLRYFDLRDFDLKDFDLKGN